MLIQFQPPAMCRVTNQQTRLPRATSSLALNASRDGWGIHTLLGQPVPVHHQEHHSQDAASAIRNLGYIGYIHLKQQQEPNRSTKVLAQGSGSTAVCRGKCPHSSQCSVAGGECGMGVLLVINSHLCSACDSFMLAPCVNFKVHLFRKTLFQGKALVSPSSQCTTG